MKPILLCWMALIVPLVSVSAQEGPDLDMRAARKQAAAAKATKGEEGKIAIAAARKVYEGIAEKHAALPVVACRARLEAGRLAERVRDMPGAEALFSAAVQCPDTGVAADALGEIAALCSRAERKDEAEKWLKQLVEHCTEEEMDHANAMLRLGELARQRSRADEAAQWFRRIMNEHGGLWRPCVDALEELVELQLNSGDREAARRLYDGHALSLRARFAGSSAEKRLDVALGRLAARAKFELGAKVG
ncbi:MAG: hypothetical protein EXS14_08890 [Planctomycetes bacterium]|nr:hypothetical protein [Planctomycetota bacterium]